MREPIQKWHSIVEYNKKIMPEVLLFISKGNSRRSAARKFGVCRNSISLVQKKLEPGYVPKKRVSPNKGKKMSEKQKRKISETRKLRKIKPWHTGLGGEQSPGWKGGLSKTRRSYCNNWRKKVLKRDNYACQLCFSDQKLEAHHILIYSKYEKYKRLIANGITLCKQCHVSIRGKEEDFGILFQSIITRRGGLV